MKIERMMRWFLSIFLSVLLVSPSVLKVYAEEGPDYILDSDTAIILDAEIGDSINDLTKIKVVWTNGSYAYLLLESSKELDTVKMNGAIASGGQLKSYDNKQSITIGGVSYTPSKKHLFFTVAKFDIASVSSGSTHAMIVTANGGGHEIGKDPDIPEDIIFPVSKV